ncbi:MAG: lipid II flippase MurJ, partial [Pirellulales bacterium]
MKPVATETDQAQLFAGIRVTSVGTFASRLLGMLRDMATAALFGLSGDGVMDAFVVAFRIPNFFRRLFGEGALAASYLPVLSKKLDEDRTAAWQVASVVLVWLSVSLVLVVLIAEGCCLALWRLEGHRPGMGLLLGLTATMIPYLFFICLAAQVAGAIALQTAFGAAQARSDQLQGAVALKSTQSDPLIVDAYLPGADAVGSFARLQHASGVARVRDIAVPSLTAAAPLEVAACSIIVALADVDRCAP